MKNSPLYMECCYASNKKDDVINALKEISACDTGFSHSSEEDCLWDEAQNYNSNMDYVLSIASKCNKAEDIIQIFFEEWIKHDCFYSNSLYKIIKNPQGDICVISFAYIPND